MNIIVHSSKSEGKINIPASKSDMHRAIIAASLANGTSTIENVTLSNDINATINAFKALGANINQKNNKLIIQGISSFSEVKNSEIDCNESGSTLRFLIPLLSIFNQEFTLVGAKSLFSRPLNIYQEIYQKQNLKFNLKESSLIINGQTKEDEYVIKETYYSILRKDSLASLFPKLVNEWDYEKNNNTYLCNSGSSIGMHKRLQQKQMCNW